ncbi:MAG: inositol monophosphatase family protein [Myxococcaceae bacterium]
MDLDSRWAFAQDLADETAALAQSWFERRSELAIEHKGPQDLVSAADRAVETLVRERVAAKFPGDKVLGEEQGGATGDNLWVVDPIDGTTNFLRGLPHYCVAIAFVHGGKTELGIVNAPTSKEKFCARLGRGATMNGQPIRVAKTTRLEDALLGWGSHRRSPGGHVLAALDSLLAQGAEYRRLGSAAINLCQVACGRLDSFYESKLAPWDALAGMLLVREAGGVTNDFLANDGLTKHNMVLAACSQEIFDAIQKATAQV